jgi:tagatose-1,6-bisphosphate aldolase non-catalytic subunit AgaZ/GatZ
MGADQQAVSQPGAAATYNSSSNMEDDDAELTLASIENSKTINFPIRATYTDWQAREAFRELVQNWCVFPPFTSAGGL